VIGPFFNKKSLGKQGANKLSDEEVISLTISEERKKREIFFLKTLRMLESHLKM